MNHSIFPRISTPLILEQQSRKTHIQDDLHLLLEGPQFSASRGICVQSDLASYMLVALNYPSKRFIRADEVGTRVA